MSVKIAIHTTRRPNKYHRIVNIIKQELARPEEVQFFHTPYPKDVLEVAEQIDVLACYTIPREAFSKAERLSWIHLGTAGIEHTLFPELIQSDVILTNARGIHAGPASEFVFTQILFFAKHLDKFREYKESRQWNQWELAAKISVLTKKTIGIVGLGAIGLQVAKKAKTFDMKVTATKYSIGPKDQYAEVDMLYPRTQLPHLLQEADVVVLTVPLTPETYHLIGARQLGHMKSTAYLINISRGKVVDQAALIEALRHNEIAGAALDVFEHEPLPMNSPLFDLDNVLLSPHISGNFPEYVDWASRDFGRNLNRYLNGQPLQNIVNKERGY